MKVIINSAGRERKEYTNLPEHDAARELLRSRLAKKKQNDTATEHSDAPSASFGPQPASATPTSETQEQEAHLDRVEAWLSDSEREHEGRESWKTSRWVPVILLAAVIVFAGMWYLASNHEEELKLERITVQGTSLLKESEILALAHLDRSQKFYSIDLKKLQERLLRHSLIKSAHPRRELNPATIVLEVEERHPVALARSASTGEAFIIDADGVIMRPKLMSGLRDQQKLLQVPLISGIRDNDSAGYRAMARLVMMMQSIDTGVLAGAIGELSRTPTGTLVIYTAETQTPIFLGSPSDQPFRTALEIERGGKQTEHAEPHFVRQLHLLAKLWKTKLAPELRSGHDFYVDARFSGEVIVKRKPGYVVKDTIHTGTATSVNLSPAIAEHR